MPLNDCRIVELPKIADPRGNLTFIEGMKDIPFKIKRAFYLYDVPSGSYRGAHAHKNLHQFIVAVSGSFDVVLNDGNSDRRTQLNRPYYGLYICPMIWQYLDNFSSGAILTASGWMAAIRSHSPGTGKPPTRAAV